MTYREIPIKKAREICSKVHKRCENCPLRRTREEVDENGEKREILLFCSFVLLKIFDNDDLMDEVEKEILLSEDIKHVDEWPEDLFESVE